MLSPLGLAEARHQITFVEFSGLALVCDSALTGKTEHSLEFLLFRTKETYS